MKRIKVSELEGAALDWAVAKCEGIEVEYGIWRTLWRVDKNVWGDRRCLQGDDGHSYFPARDWEQGGPIIERENILLNPQYPWWASTMRHIAALNTNSLIYTGPTPLVAAMRCYVASKLGDEIEVPEELLK